MEYIGCSPEEREEILKKFVLFRNPNLPTVRETKDRVFAHYGHERFVKELFCPVVNEPGWIKPAFGTGFYASDVDSEYGWKQWVEDEQFHLDKYLSSFFLFKVKEDARIFHLRTLEDMCNAPEAPNPFGLKGHYLIDFEKLSQYYDAIDYYETSELHYPLYGWDCDTLLVMNPDIIIPIG